MNVVEVEKLLKIETVENKYIKTEWIYSVPLYSRKIDPQSHRTF